jgi:hypothetical protein
MTPPENIGHARLLLVIAFLACVILILLFDVWAWATHGKEATASTLIHLWAKEWPLLPFLVGMVIGHLFW